MPDELRMPPDADAVRMVQAGWSFAEIHAYVEQYAGRPVIQAVVVAWLSRVALTRIAGHRYHATVPWRVRPEHSGEYAPRMLRLLGRRRESFPLSDEQTASLDTWLAMLERERVIVAYCPEHDDGFVYVDESLRQGPDPDIPIRVATLRLDEVLDNPYGDP